MKCFNEDTLEAFIVNELSDAENENIISHIAECEKCFKKAMDIADSERKLTGSLVSPDEKKPMPSKSKSTCVNKKLLMGYVIGGLEKNGMDYVESHLRECNECLIRMMVLQKNYSHDAGLTLDTVALKSEVHKDTKDIFTIILRDVGRRVFEVIETTGILLTPPSPAMEATRGKKISPKTDEVHIRKDFPHMKLSIEVALKGRVKTDTFDIELSLMKMEGNKITGIIEPTKVNISGMGIEKEVVTDDMGEIEFKDLYYGDYKILLQNGINVYIQTRGVYETNYPTVI